MVPLAAYCERSGPGFWAEPWNAWTNLSFVLVAAALAAHVWRRRGGGARTADLWLLAALIGAVGFGSFLWHTLRAPWSQWADITPILLVINLFLASFAWRVAQLSGSAIAVVLLVYNLVNLLVLAVLPRGFLNGSALYFPTWVALTILCGFALRRARTRAPALLLAAFTFTASLFLRTLDLPLCASFPRGTHFAWHVLNGAVLYAAVTTLLPPRPSARP